MNEEIVSDGTVWGSEEWYTKRWESIPEESKEKILNHLRRLKNIEELKKLADDPWFHFGAGMGLRNYLREALNDQQLPPAPYPNNENVRNWDDYYIEALKHA